MLKDYKYLIMHIILGMHRFAIPALWDIFTFSLCFVNFTKLQIINMHGDSWQYRIAFQHLYNLKENKYVKILDKSQWLKAWKTFKWRLSFFFFFYYNVSCWNELVLCHIYVKINFSFKIPFVIKLKCWNMSNIQTLINWHVILYNKSR